MPIKELPWLVPFTMTGAYHELCIKLYNPLGFDVEPWQTQEYYAALFWDWFLSNWVATDIMVPNPTNWTPYIPLIDAIDYIYNNIQNIANTDELPEWTTNLYFTTARARQALGSISAGLLYNTTTWEISIDPNYKLPTNTEFNAKANTTDVNTAISTAINNLINSAPWTLDTLKEIATALGNDPNFATTITNLLNQKANSVDVYTKSQVDWLLTTKQNLLVSWLTIKTVNWNSLLWSWDIAIAWWWWVASLDWLSDVAITNPQNWQIIRYEWWIFVNSSVSFWDMTKQVYDTNNSWFVDNSEALWWQTLAQVRDRTSHTWTQAISTITWLQTALDWKEPTITNWTSAQYIKWDKTLWTLDKAAVWLWNVDNTSDALKPVSNATITALSWKQDSLWFTPENVANKENTTLDTSTTKYPTNNLVKGALDLKANSSDVYTKTELDWWQLDNRYFTEAETNTQITNAITWISSNAWFQEAVEDLIWTKIVAWNNITTSYNDTSWETTINSVWWHISWEIIKIYTTTWSWYTLLKTEFKWEPVFVDTLWDINDYSLYWNAENNKLFSISKDWTFWYYNGNTVWYDFIPLANYPAPNWTNTWILASYDSWIGNNQPTRYYRYYLWNNHYLYNADTNIWSLENNNTWLNIATKKWILANYNTLYFVSYTYPDTYLNIYEGSTNTNTQHILAGNWNYWNPSQFYFVHKSNLLWKTEYSVAFNSNLVYIHFSWYDWFIFNAWTFDVETLPWATTNWYLTSDWWERPLLLNLYGLDRYDSPLINTTVNYDANTFPNINLRYNYKLTSNNSIGALGYLGLYYVLVNSIYQLKAKPIYTYRKD